MTKSNPTLSPTKVNLVVDSTIFVTFLIAMSPRFSGLSVHEWLGIAFAATLLTHLLLHWDWIVNVTKRIFNPTLQQKQRLNYALNLALFVDFVIISLSGIMISQVALPALGVRLQEGFAWRSIHSLTSNLALLLVGTHIALHWSWITKNITRYVIAPLGARGRKIEGFSSNTEAQS